MTEQELRELIELKYGSVRQMALKIDMPASTINSILNRGILKSNVDNIFKICSALGIRPETLADGVDFHKAETEAPEILMVYNQLEELRQEKVLGFANAQLDEQESSKVVSIFEKVSNSMTLTVYVPFKIGAV